MNPELRVGGENPDGWVSYAQELLATALADEIADGQIQTVPNDDEFGDATEAAVRVLQEREGLPATGTIDAATWEAMGAEIVDDDQSDPQSEQQSEQQAGGQADDDQSDQQGGETGDQQPSGASGEPIDLRIPFELQLQWDETDLERMLSDFESIELANQPNAQLTFPEPVGRLFGNGGMQWLEWELRSNPTVYVEAATQAIIGWSGSQGIELGTDNDLEAGLRFRGVDLFVSGELDARVYPMEGTGEISGGAQMGIRLRLGEIVR